MTRPYLPLMAALFLTFPLFAQQNATPPLYPAPGNPADAQSQQNVSAAGQCSDAGFPSATCRSAAPAPSTTGTAAARRRSTSRARALCRPLLEKLRSTARKEGSPSMSN